MELIRTLSFKARIWTRFLKKIICIIRCKKEKLKLKKKFWNQLNVSCMIYIKVDISCVLYAIEFSVNKRNEVPVYINVLNL